MDGLIKLGCVVGVIGLVSAVESYQAGKEEAPRDEELLKEYVRERTAELIGEGYEAHQAYAIASREAGEVT